MNVFNVKHHYPMPNLEHELNKVGKSKYYANFDFSNSYWKLKTTEESQEIQSFITPDGIFTPNRVMHGTTNAVTHLQSSVAGVIPEDLKPYILCWIDEIIFHAPTVDSMLDAIKSLFDL